MRRFVDDVDDDCLHFLAAVFVVITNAGVVVVALAAVAVATAAKCDDSNSNINISDDVSAASDDDDGGNDERRRLLLLLTVAVAASLIAALLRLCDPIIVGLTASLGILCHAPSTCLLKSAAARVVGVLRRLLVCKPPSFVADLSRSDDVIFLLNGQTDGRTPFLNHDDERRRWRAQQRMPSEREGRRPETADEQPAIATDSHNTYSNNTRQRTCSCVSAVLARPLSGAFIERLRRFLSCRITNRRMRRRRQSRQRSRRVYIGGIDPSVSDLTVQEVLERFRNDVEKRGMRLRNVQDRTKYCHVDVVVDDGDGDKDDDDSNSSSDSDNDGIGNDDNADDNFDDGGDDEDSASSPSSSLSPLLGTTLDEVIRKGYHNVTWKGCRLRCEPARPHFLDRLRREREERQSREQRQQEEQQQPQQPENAPSASSSRLASESNLLPRHLKIRSRFGQTAYKVDTKPRTVRDWPSFAEILGKERKKRRLLQLRQLQQSQASSKSRNIKSTVDDNKNSENDAPPEYWDRSVRLCFRRREDYSDNGGGAGADDEDEDSNGERALSPNGGRVDSIDFSTHQRTTGPSFLADDDIDGDPTTTSDSSSESDDSQSDDDDDDDTVPMSNPSSGEAAAKGEATAGDAGGGGTYVWSDSDDDESSSEADDAGEESFRTTGFKSVPDTSEFDPGVAVWDNQSVGDDRRGVVEERSGAADSEEVEGDLKADVETNLAVLQQIFPDWTPAAKASEDTSGDGRDNGISGDVDNTNRGQSKISGWGASGQMLRFDPTKPSMADQYVVKEEEEEEEARDADGRRGETGNASRDASSSSGSDGDSSEASATTASNDTGERDQAGHLYRQDKLEAVFKEAREEPTQGAKSAEGGQFAFSFGLPGNKEHETQIPSQKDPPPSSAEFSFSFNLSDGPDKRANESVEAPSREEERQQLGGTEDSSQLPGNVEQRKPRRRRRFGPDFMTNEELDARVEAFYRLNDGERIATDLEGWRRDPAVKERWLAERAALTQDWKRKRKHAVAVAANIKKKQRNQYY